MKCPECGATMELLIFEVRGPLWVCECGRTLNDGTSALEIPVYTASNLRI